MSEPSDLVPYLWLLRGDDGPPYGGGICVHSSGILMTISHSMGFDLHNSTITARNYKGNVFRSGKWISNKYSKSHGISFFKLQNDNEEVFEVFTLSDTIPVDVGVKIFAFTCCANIPFYLLSGKVCGTSVCSSLDEFEEEINSAATSTGDSADDDDDDLDLDLDDSALGDVLTKRILSMEKELELIQVQGFDLFTFSGQCGWPVFTFGDQRLVGLISFSTGFFKFLIPTDVLLMVYNGSRDILGLAANGDGGGGKEGGEAMDVDG